MTTPPIERIESLLSTPKRIVLVIHQSPDGDALGSGLAMAQWLNKLGHQATLVSPDHAPAFLQWMPGLKDALFYEEGKDQITAQRRIDEAEVIICLDFPELHRTGAIAPLVAARDVPKISLDHHPVCEPFAALTWVDTAASATAVLVYRLIHALGQQAALDASVATCLYTGIHTDTGGFSYKNTNAEALQVAGKLVEYGADLPTIRDRLSPQRPLKKVRFFSYMLLKRLTLLPQYRTAILQLPRTDYLRFYLQSGDTEGLVNEGLMIEGVLLSVLVVEKEDKTCLSFRSRNPVPVNLLAQQYFSGGGHRNASGGFSEASMEETVAKLREMVEREMPKYSKDKRGAHAS